MWLNSQTDVDVWDASDGLSDRVCNDLVKDANGFLWLGTANGLNRYDGYQFLIYNNAPDNPNQISHNDVFRLALTNDSLLLVCNSVHTVDLLDPKTNHLTKLEVGSLTATPSQIRHIYQTVDGEVFFIGENDESINLFQYQAGQIVPVWDYQIARFSNPQKTMPNQPRFHLVKSAVNDLIIYDVENGLISLARDKAQGCFYTKFDFKPIPLCAQTNEHVFEYISFLIKDRSNRIWLSFSSKPGLYQYDLASACFVLQKNFPKDLYFNSASIDQRGNIVFHTGAKPYNYKSSYLLNTTGQLKSFLQDFVFENIYAKVIGEDFEQLVYRVSQAGIQKINVKSSQVTNYLEQDLDITELGISTRGIAEDKYGNIIVNTEGDGWYILSSATDLMAKRVMEPLPFAYLPDKDLHSPVFGRNFVEDSLGYLWSSAYKSHDELIPKGFLLRYDPATKTIQSYLSKYRIESLALSHNHQLWLTGTETIEIFDLKTQTFQSYRDQEGKAPLAGLNSYAVIESQDHLIWVATSEGLLRIDPQRRSSQLLKREKDGTGPKFSSNFFLTIHEAKDGKLWLGTYGAGLNIYDPTTGKVEIYTEEEGLANSNVCAIEEEEGNYWLSTYDGLSYFNAKTRQFRNFSVANGFSHHEFNRLSSFRDRRGNFYFGGMNGLNVFKSQDLLQSSKPPSIFLSEIAFYDPSIDEVKRQYCGLQELDKICLAAKNRYLHLRFGLDDYQQPKHNRFAYYLEGYDAFWHQIENRNEVVFNNLPPGKYRLYIKGANYEGIWTEKILQIPIVVHAFFYQQWWFITSIIVVILGITYVFYRYRVQQIMRLMQIRTKIASDLHDEVGGVLVGIAMQTEMLELSPQQPSKASIGHVKELSRDALSRMRDVVWSIDSRRDKIQNLIDRMREQAEELLSPKHISYNIEIRNTDLERRLRPELRQHLYLIFKECLTNTVKHAQAKRVEVFLGNRGPYFEMSIKDDGIGLQEDKKSTGLGLDNIKMRATKIGAEVFIQNEDGFLVFLQMPAV